MKIVVISALLWIRLKFFCFVFFFPEMILLWNSIVFWFLRITLYSVYVIKEISFPYVWIIAD